MSRLAFLPFVFFLCVAYGAIDGIVINRTTGKPQPGATITLYSVGGPGGLKPLKTVRTDAQGAFRIDQEIAGPSLLQTIHAAVTYNQILPPGSKTTGLEVPVYEASAKVPSARVSQT